MKKFSKVLSLLLAVCMILGTFCIVSAEEEVTLPSKLIDLNLDNMVKSTTDSTSGVVNAGESETTTIQIKSSSYVSLSKAMFTNNSGSQTDYINLNTGSAWNWTDPNNYFYLTDNAMETTSNTISFWVDPNNISKPSNQKYGNIINYYVKYNNEGTDVTQNLEISEVNAEDGNNYTWNTGDSFTDGINMDSSKGWTHVAITNPLLTDGTKTMDIYINGVYKKSKTLTIPEGATLTSAGIYFGGSATKPSYANRMKEANYGDITVYNGVLNEEQITKLYTEQAPSYVPLDLETAQKLFDLDLTNFASTSTTGANGAINAGTSTTSDIKLWNWRYGTTNDRIYLTKKEMSNTAGGISEYINYSSKGATWTSSLQTTMSDLAWEEEDTTISFWMTPATESVTSERILASYNLAYTNESGTVTNKYINIWEIGSKNLKTANDGSTAVTAKDGFNHFVIVNKKADSSGNKSCDLYVNGAFYKTLTIEKPADTTLTNASLSFGYSPNASNNQARYVLDFGKVQVYKGLFAAADIKDLYDLQAPEMTVLALADAPKLLDLNIDNFYPTTTEGSSGITNAGTSTTANLDIYSTAQVRVDKQSLMSADLTTAKPYIYMSHPFGHQISSGTALGQHFDISDTAWTNQPVTISFWADLDRSMQQDSGQSYCWIATYNVDYTNADATTGNNETGLWQYGLDTDTNYYWGKGSWKNDIAMNSSREWAHVAFAVSDNRSIKMYVNGVDQGTVTLDIPEDAEITNATLRFGGNRANKYLPGDLSIADVKVYGALLTDTLVKEIYDAEKETYANAGEAKITFSKADGTGIVKLNGITADGTTNITVKYTDTITPDCTIIAASYDDEFNLITAKKVVTEEGSGSFEFPILKDTKTIRVFVWEEGVYSPIQKVTSIQYNDN